MELGLFELLHDPSVHDPDVLGCGGETQADVMCDENDRAAAEEFPFEAILDNVLRGVHVDCGEPGEEKKRGGVTIIITSPKLTRCCEVIDGETEINSRVVKEYALEDKVYINVRS